MSEPVQIVHESKQALADVLAKEITRDLKVSDRPFLILPGGSSPRQLIESLAQQDIDWSTIQITTTDERCVPLEDEASNAGQIQRIFEQYDQKPHLFWLQEDSSAAEYPWPATATVLGMGLDGHFASLFSSESCAEKGYTLRTKAPFTPTERISLTLEAILRSNRLILLIPDQEKQAICDEVLAGKGSNFPISHLFSAAKEHLELHGVDSSA